MGDHSVVVDRTIVDSKTVTRNGELHQVRKDFRTFVGSLNASENVFLTTTSESFFFMVSVYHRLDQSCIRINSVQKIQ